MSDGIVIHKGDVEVIDITDQDESARGTAVRANINGNRDLIVQRRRADAQ